MRLIQPGHMICMQDAWERAKERTSEAGEAAKSSAEVCAHACN